VPLSVLDSQCESQPVIYITGVELSSLNLHPNTTQVIAYKTDTQLVKDINNLNPQYPFYILSSEQPPVHLMSNPLLLHYYHVSTAMLHAENNFTTDDRVTDIDSIDRFSSEFYTDLAQYYRDSACQGLLQQPDNKDKFKALLEKSKKCLEMLKYTIERLVVNADASHRSS
jgi:hypothetical protein